MIFVVLLALGAQEPPLEAEKDRIRSKVPLTADERAAYSLPAAKPVTPRTSYRLGILPLSYSGRAFGETDLAALFFKRVAKYFSDVSGGRFVLKGKVFDPVVLGSTRDAFEEDDLVLALAAIRGRDGKDALKNVDGVAFVGAGPMGKRGTPLWPGSGRLPAGERTLDYLFMTEEGAGHEVGIAAHELMHLLGFSDKYDDAKAEVGPWCIMGTGYATVPPAPPCADCRERLGWTAPGVLDVGRKARVVLGSGAARSVKVQVNPDGSEYLLMELRDRLFIWHVGGGKKIELIGQYPSDSNDRLTPLSEPSFRGRSVGARPVWVTDIRLEDGKAWFRVAPKAERTPLEAWRRARIGRRLGE